MYLPYCDTLPPNGIVEVCHHWLGWWLVWPKDIIYTNHKELSIEHKRSQRIKTQQISLKDTNSKIWFAESYPCYSPLNMLIFLKFTKLTHSPLADNGGNFESVTFEYIFEYVRIKFVSNSCEITGRWMPQNTFHDKLILVQVMVWRR